MKDLDTLAPTCEGLSNYYQVNWTHILSAQRRGIYMRPLFTLTPEGDPHFNCVIVVQGQIMLLDTWDDEQISTHTAISLAFHTVEDGFNSIPSSTAETREDEAVFQYSVFLHGPFGLLPPR